MRRKKKGPLYEKGDLYIREIPKWLRDLFKASCVARGSNMKKELIKFMQDYTGHNHCPVSLRSINTKRPGPRKNANEKAKRKAGI